MLVVVVVVVAVQQLVQQYFMYFQSFNNKYITIFPIYADKRNTYL
jgi:hypothetical protein